MKYSINRVAVIGSGTMGGALAAHCANAGLPVMLLDIVPDALTPEEEKKGLTLQSPQVRNRIVNAGLDAQKKIRPAAFFTPQVAERITVGNLQDHFDLLRDADWILEAIVENLDIKRQLMARLEKIRKPTAIVTTNTSGIPIRDIAAQCSADFKRHFLGTHFFNPPRYLKMLEVIPGESTLPAVVEALREFGENVLGKGVVICKDTPNFIGNRLMSFAGSYGMKYTLENGYAFNEVDDLTGELIGHPKSASYRLGDLVGIDVMYFVRENTYNAIANDEMREVYKSPEILREMVKRGWLGNKSGQGFYKQVKTPEGKREFHVLDPKTMEYKPAEKVFYDSVLQAETIENLGERLKYLVAQEDRAGKFIWNTLAANLAYTSLRVPEIADEIVSVDHAIKWGFLHQMGPFETWDTLGVAETVARMEAQGLKVAAWVKEMLATGHPTFYKDGKYYDLKSKDYKPIPARKGVTVLREQKVIKQNESASLLDLGDGVACLEFHTKFNALDEGIVEIARAALDEIDRNFVGLVVGNQGEHFSAGANVMTIGLAAENKEWDKINTATKALQDFLMAMRFSPKPVVTAPHGYTLGGGCEVAMAGAKIVAHAESYVGLVEVGMGLIPAGGGCKEMLRRIVSPAMQTPNADMLPFMQRVFETVGTAKVATSAAEAIQFGFFAPSDRIVMNLDQQITHAKNEVLTLVAAGYRAPTRGKNIYAAGERALAALRIAIYSLMQGKYISEYDAQVGQKLAWVMAGGDLTAPTWVDEQFILDLEREAFVSLCGEAKTRERIWHFLNTGKPLRN
ncbi:MAG: 3-hydroxyacyl-CoA dehydrogenase/enoyl-CoA hydratase family protein [Chloroflexi bacterium]|nr:3-hydroxyacyl-CoA dehydrogenase/enoyl-CoA hydratase family protein [Chloroflexota bacterium]